MDRWADHVARARAGDRRAAAELVEGNLGLVRSFARRLSGYRVDREELVAEGVLGLLEAIRAHDASRGSSFITTAAHWIRRRQLEAVRDARTLGTVGRTQLAGRLWWSLPRMWEEAQAASDPIGYLVERIAARTGHRPSREAAMSAIHARGVVPLHTDAAGGRSPEADFARAELAHRVRAAVARLPSDSRDLVRRTVLADEAETLTQVGGGRGAPRMRASRAQQNAFAQLRRELSDLDEHRRAA